MNKRLEEIALECGAWHQVYEPKRFMHDHNFDKEKFAELIVRECAHLVGGYTKENEFGTDVKEAYEEITKHFGVEE